MPHHNAADEDQVELAAENAEMARQQELEDVKTLMDTAAGERFFRRLLAVGGVFNSSFTGNSKTYFLEGHRNMALIFLTDLLEATPDKVAGLIVVDRREDNG